MACSQYERGRNTPYIHALPNTFQGSYMFDFDLFLMMLDDDDDDGDGDDDDVVDDDD